MKSGIYNPGPFPPLRGIEGGFLSNFTHFSKEIYMEFTNMITGQTVTPTDWQQALKVGDYYCIAKPVVAVIDPNTGHAGSLGPNEVPAVYGRIVSAVPRAPGHFWAKAYSQWCPDGETGLVCIVDPTHQLTKDEFNQAKASGWPTTFANTEERKES